MVRNDSHIHVADEIESHVVTGSQNIPNAILPPYRLARHGDPVLLYSGPLTTVAQARQSQVSVEGVGSFLLRLSPEPQISWEFYTRDSGHLTISAPDATIAPVIPQFATLPLGNGMDEPPRVVAIGPPPAHHYLEGRIGRRCIGRRDGLAELRFLLWSPVLNVGQRQIRYPNGEERRARIAFGFDGWDIDVDLWPDWWTYSRQVGGKLPLTTMRVGRIRRHDRSSFSVDDSEPLTACLFDFLSFVSGRGVGIATPVGYDAHGAPRYAEWSLTLLDVSSSEVTSWYPVGHPESLSGGFRSFASLWYDPTYLHALATLVRIYTSSNISSSRVGIVVSFTGLETLCTLLPAHCPSLRSVTLGRSAAAKKRIRSLLTAVGIDTTIPAHFPAMLAYATSRTPPLDGPATIASVRNKIVHRATKRLDGEPLYSEVHTLSLWYLELLLLRLIGYDGKYNKRIAPSPNIANPASVPWAP